MSINKVRELANNSKFYVENNLESDTLLHIVFTDDDNNSFRVYEIGSGEEYDVDYADVDLTTAKFYDLQEVK